MKASDLSASQSGGWTFVLCASVSDCCLSSRQPVPFVAPETGQQVRAGIFNDEFWSTLLVVASPFPVLLLAIAAYHFGWPPFSTNSSSTAAQKQ